MSQNCNLAMILMSCGIRLRGSVYSLRLHCKHERGQMQSSGLHSKFATRSDMFVFQTDIKEAGDSMLILWGGSQTDTELMKNNKKLIL